MGNFLKYVHPLLKRKKSDKNYEDVNYAIINALDTEIGLVEKEAMASKIQSSLKSATGEYLDLWGDWFYVTRRENEEDDVYRERIIKFLLLKRGTNNAIIDAIREFLNDYDSYISIYEPFTNIFYTNKSNLNGEDHLMGDYYRFAIIDITLGRKFPAEIIDIINEFKPAGVKFFLTYDHARDVEGDGILDMPTANLQVSSRTRISTLGGYGGYIRGHVNLGNLTYKSIFDYEGDESEKQNIFHTNNSSLNGLDVLGGESGAGSKYANTAMLTSKSYYPTSDDTPYTFSTTDGVELMDYEFNRGTQRVDNSVGVLRTLGESKVSNLYVGLDVYRYLNLNYPNTIKDAINAEDLRNKITKVAKTPKLSLKANALVSPTEPLPINVYIFNFTYNQWDFVGTANLDVRGSYVNAELGNLHDNISDTGTVFVKGTIESTEEPVQINIDYLDLSFKDYVKDVYTILPYEGTVVGHHKLISMVREVDAFKTYTGHNPEVMLDSYYRPTGFYRIKGLGSTRISHILKDEDYHTGIESEDNEYHYKPTGILSKSYLKPFLITDGKVELDLLYNFAFAEYYTLSFIANDGVDLSNYILQFYQEKKSTNTQELVVSYDLAESSISAEGIVSQTKQVLTYPYAGTGEDDDHRFYVTAKYKGEPSAQESLNVKAFVLNNASIVESVKTDASSISYKGTTNFKDYIIEDVEGGVHLKAPTDNAFDFSFRIPDYPTYDDSKPYYYNNLVNKNLKPVLLIPYKVVEGSKDTGMVKASIKDVSDSSILSNFYMNNNKGSDKNYDFLIVPLPKVNREVSLYIGTNAITGLNIIGDAKVSFYTEDNTITLNSTSAYLPIVSKEYIIKGDMTIKFKSDKALPYEDFELAYGSVHTQEHDSYPAPLKYTQKISATPVDETTSEYLITTRVPSTRRGYSIDMATTYINNMDNVTFTSKDDTFSFSKDRENSYTMSTYNSPIDASAPIYGSSVFSEYPTRVDRKDYYLYMGLLSPVSATVKISTTGNQEYTYELEPNKMYRVGVPAPIEKDREEQIKLHIKSSATELSYSSFVYNSKGADLARLIREDEPLRLKVPMREGTMSMRDIEVTVPQSEDIDEGLTDSYLTVTSTSGDDIVLYEYKADSLNKERKNYTLHGNYTNIAKVTYHSDGLLKNVEIERSVDGKNWKSIKRISPDLGEGEQEDVPNELIGKYGIELFSLGTINAMSKVLLRNLWETTIGEFDGANENDVNSISNDFFNTTFTNLSHLAELPENKITVITDIRGGNMNNSSGEVINMSGGLPQTRTRVHMYSETMTRYKLALLAGSYIGLDSLEDLTYNDEEYEVIEDYKAYSYHKENK